VITPVQQRLLRCLADGELHSGTALGEVLGISRAAVWKQIQALQEQGVEILSEQRQGYTLPGAVTLLDRSEIRGGLTAAVGQRLPQIETLWGCDSSNSELMRRLRRGEAVSGHVLLSEYQSAGRGRRGKQWLSPFGGSLYLSLLWRFSGGLMALSGVGIVVGIAMAQAVEAIGLEGAQLKWPNDLHYADQKLGGVLIELEGESDGPTDVVIGVGLNVMLSDQQGQIDQPWTALQRYFDLPLSRNRLAAVLLNHLLPLLDRFERGGLEALLPQWESLDRLRDHPVVVLQEGRESQERHESYGIARGIDAMGALLVESNGVVQRHFSGDVSLRLRSAGSR
jgi:BirA family biotin operon repressor/biotin-[acetyl-CoA-carboxylase] ligase